MLFYSVVLWELILICYRFVGQIVRRICFLRKDITAPPLVLQDVANGSWLSI